MTLLDDGGVLAMTWWEWVLGIWLAVQWPAGRLAAWVLTRRGRS